MKDNEFFYNLAEFLCQLYPGRPRAYDSDLFISHVEALLGPIRWVEPFPFKLIEPFIVRNISFGSNTNIEQKILSLIDISAFGFDSPLAVNVIECSRSNPGVEDGVFA